MHVPDALALANTPRQYESLMAHDRPLGSILIFLHFPVASCEKIVYLIDVAFDRRNFMGKIIKYVAIAAACVISAFGVYCLIKYSSADEKIEDKSEE